MNSLTLKRENGRYRYNYKETKDELLQLIAEIFTTEEIYYSDYYKEFLYEFPYQEYSGNAYYIDRISNFVVLGSLYSYERAYLVLSKFENFISLWRAAYKDKPDEMTLSVDENKNFKISYKKIKKILKNNQRTCQKIKSQPL